MPSRYLDRDLQELTAQVAETQRLTHTGSWAYNHVREEYTYYSDEQFRIYGFDPACGRLPKREEILGRFHPEDRERMLDLAERIIREKRDYTADYRIVLPSGAVRYLHSLGHPILDERGARFATGAGRTAQHASRVRRNDIVLETRLGEDLPRVRGDRGADRSARLRGRPGPGTRN